MNRDFNNFRKRATPPTDFDRCPRIAAVIAGVVAVVCMGTPPAVADDTSWSAHGQVGVEFDDNPPRLEDYDGGGDASTRYLVGGDVSSRIDSAMRASMSLRHGGKFFRRESDNNALLTRAAASATWRPLSGVYARPTANVKDRTEADNRLDYTRGGAAVQLGGHVGDVTPWAEAGGRFFAFKPRPPASHRGLQMRTGVRWRIRDDLSADLSGARSRRTYGTVAWELDGDRFVRSPDGTHRLDIYHMGRLAIQYRSGFDARLRIQHARNGSNSYGQSMRRWGAEAAVTAPLFWQMVASARGEFQWTRYEDPVHIDDTVRIDEENRNTFAAAVNRPLVDPWEIELRYDLFFQEFGAGRDYLRQIIAVSVGVYLDR